MNAPRRHRLKDKTLPDSGEEAVPEFIQAILKKYGGKLERQPPSQPLHVRAHPRQPPADYVAEAEKFKAEAMEQVRRKCDEQITIAQAGQQHEAALNLDLLMTEVRNTLWGDVILSTSLRKIIEHAQHQVRATAGIASTAKPAPTDEMIRVTADGRCLYRGKKLILKLTADEARWVERCIEINRIDGREDFRQREISLHVFGNSTDRFKPSRIFRTHGEKAFWMIFEKTKDSGIVTKRDDVTFEES